MRHALEWVCSPLSCCLGRLLYGRWEPLCSLAYGRNDREFIERWNRIMGDPHHCLNSWIHWRR